MLNIYRGRESVDREKFIYERAKKDGGRTLVIVPDQYTLAAERQAMDRLQTEVLLDIEILGISRLGYRLLSETGEPKSTVINQYGRHMLINRLLRKHNEELLAFKGMAGKVSFVEAINDFISAAKQHEISPGDLAQKASEKSGELSLGAFSRKLHDLALIYDKYEKALRGKYTDNEDRIDLFVAAAKKSRTLPKCKVWVYGFDSFTPKNISLLMAIAGCAKELNIFLTYDQQCKDEDLFALSEITTNRFIKAAKEAGIETRTEKVEAPLVEKKPALAFLEKNLFAVGPDQADDFDGIEIIECNDPYSEAEAAAAKVHKLLRDKDNPLRLSDIVIICNDQKVRTPIITRVFSEFGLGVFDDKKRDVLSSPIAVYIMSLIDICGYHNQTQDIVRLLKTGLTDLEWREIEELENYATKYGILGWQWEKPFVRGEHERRYQEGGLEKIEETRQRVMETIGEVSAIYNEAKTYGEFASKYFDYLKTENGLAEKVEALANRQSQLGQLDEAEETVQIWEVIGNLFEQIAEIMEDEDFDGREFAALLRSGLGNIEVGVLPPTADDMLLGTMQRTRSGDAKAFLIIGANEGLIPRSAKEGILFSPEEIELLSQEGQDLGLRMDLRLMEENLAIYRNLSKPTELLWMSYSSVDETGHEILPSEIVTSIKGIFPKLKNTSYEELAKDIFERIGGHLNTLRHYTEIKMKEKARKVSPEEMVPWNIVGEWLEGGGVTEAAGDAGRAGRAGTAVRAEDLVRAEVAELAADADALAREIADKKALFKRVRDALDFENEREPLPDNLASALYAKYFDDEGKPVYRFSPTNLERYNDCPFKYFIGSGLRAEELRADQVGAREIGELYHSAIEEYTARVTDQKAWGTLSRDESDNMIETIITQWAEDYRSQVFSKTNSEEYLLHRAKEACKVIAWSLMEQAREGEIEESFYEVPFGRGRDSGMVLPAIERELEQGRALITGVIDRVDILPDGRVKIIDYKTGSLNSTFKMDEVKAGYRLQLMLYLEAAREGKRKPAGVFYFRIKEPILEFANKSKSDEKNASVGLDYFYQMDGVMVDEDNVVQEIAGEFGPEEKSKVLNIKRKVDGDLDSYSRKKLISDEEFDEIQEIIKDATTEICNEIVNGKIDVAPKWLGSDKTACDYCPYGSICKFDTSFAGCSYTYIVPRAAQNL